MEFAQTGNTIIARLDRGEELFKTLETFTLEHQYKSASLTGIGALYDVELGAYDLVNKVYIRNQYPDDAELCSLTGNLSWIDGKPFFHLHGVLADQNNRCFGGHLFSAKVAVICEITMQVYHLPIERSLNEDIGLKCLDFTRCAIINKKTEPKR